MGRFCLLSLSLGMGLLNFITSASAQTQYRRFTRTPYYNGPNDPERNKIRGVLKLGETVIIDLPGDTGDTDLKPGVVPEPNVTLRGAPVQAVLSRDRRHQAARLGGDQDHRFEAGPLRL